MTGRHLVLAKHYEPPPKSRFKRSLMAWRRDEVTIIVDSYGNAEVYIPGNAKRLTQIQLGLVNALERAAGWKE